MGKDIMLAFVSPVTPKYLSEPIPYMIQGKPYNAIQTNEAAIVYVQRKLGENKPLSRIFLIASDFVKTKPVAPENEFGDVTHLEFLQRRLAKEFPQLAKKFFVQDYSEEATGSDKLERDILQVAAIAETITSFANRSSADEITVHVDMTGGFRHTSMLMLSIIQLLKYRGIKIEEVLYSDPTSRMVYPVTEIQRMFSLITGADEFVKFGSVEALNEYFGDNKPPAVKALLEAMNRFAEAIKICRTSAIEDELTNLGKHIQTFREHPDKDLKSELFAKILDTIKLEYGNLISGTSERLEIILWCMRKSFWQQAMTLCSEWLPEELVKRKICMPSDMHTIETCKAKGRSAHKTWQQYFIIDYYKSAEKSSDKDNHIEADVCKNLRGILENFSAKKLGDVKIFAELKNFFYEYTDGKLLFERCQRGQIQVKVFKKNFPKLAAALNEIYEERKKNPNYGKFFYEFLKSLRHADIPKLIAKLPDDKILELFKIERPEIQKKAFKPAEKSESKWEQREKEYRRMFDEKIICSSLDVNSALKFLHDYFDLRNERNQINHANAQATKPISELKPIIENYLAALKKIKAAR